MDRRAYIKHIVFGLHRLEFLNHLRRNQTIGIERAHAAWSTLKLRYSPILRDALVFDPNLLSACTEAFERHATGLEAPLAQKLRAEIIDTCPAVERLLDQGRSPEEPRHQPALRGPRLSREPEGPRASGPLSGYFVVPQNLISDPVTSLPDSSFEMRTRRA